MTARLKGWRAYALGLLLASSAISTAGAAVTVDIVGNTAFATINLDDGAGGSVDAQVTIVFDSPLNLTAQSLNLTAQLVAPNDPAITSRLPLGNAIDPAFPMLITVEPVDLGWIFTTNFEEGEDGTGPLAFLNTYYMEVHTAELVYQTNSRYRLLKAPVGGAFADVTEEIVSGSVRARGRGGAFSQFVVAKRNGLLVNTLDLPIKLLALDTRILAAALDDTLRVDLLGLLADVQTAVGILNFTAAIASLDQLIAEIQAHAGVDIANVWRAQHDVVNDAGELESLATTLRFTLVRLQAGDL